MCDSLRHLWSHGGIPQRPRPLLCWFPVLFHLPLVSKTVKCRGETCVLLFSGGICGRWTRNSLREWLLLMAIVHPLSRGNKESESPDAMWRKCALESPPSSAHLRGVARNYGVCLQEVRHDKIPSNNTGLLGDFGIATKSHSATQHDSLCLSECHWLCSIK